MSKIIDLTGKIFHKLTVLKRAKKTQNHYACWECLCECGNVTVVCGNDLRTGHTGSCGCLRKELAFKKTFVHGMSNTSTYNTWFHMINRCYNPADSTFANYGGRGITVCQKWRNDFMAFYKDVGERPSKKHSIDRIDTNGDYNPTNVRWATQKEQCNNKRNNINITINGQMHTAIQWASLVGIEPNTLYARLRRGWPPEKAILAPIRHRNKTI